MDTALAPGLRSILREATATEHRRVEERLGLASPSLSLERYLRFLLGMEAFQRDLEPRLLASTAIDMRGRAKSAWLAADLAHFRLARATHPLAWDGDCLDTRAKVLGCAYVMEGSTLGGTVLYPLLSQRLGLAPGRGARYIFGYGARTGAMWRAFVKELDALPLRRAEVEECIVAARRTFTRLGDEF